MRKQPSVSRENGKGFTGQGQRHLPPSDVSGQIPCQVTGTAFTRPTMLYVEPSRLAKVVDKYRDLGACLVYPPAAQVHIDDYHAALAEAEVPLEPVIIPVLPVKPRKATSKPLICLTNGRFFNSTEEAALACGMHGPSIYAHLVKGAPHAKGYRFRLANPAEIERYDANPARWTFDEPLLPMLPTNNRKAKKD